MANPKESEENRFFLSLGLLLSSLCLAVLYFSEIRQYEPCELCWYQRIVMYPFVIILGIAYIKKDYQIAFYSMILSAIGRLYFFIPLFDTKVNFY